jgi:hypothetical protein
MNMSTEKRTADVYLDVNYQEIWDAADYRFSRWLSEYIESAGHFPTIDSYSQRLHKAAKEVLDALALEDTRVEEHLDIMCFEQGEQYVVDIRPLSPIGDAFLMVYRHEEAERA